MVGNKVYNQEDKVMEEMIIKQIHPNSVVFKYKNEEITLEYKGK
jgi:hypothetical protein